MPMGTTKICKEPDIRLYTEDTMGCASPTLLLSASITVTLSLHRPTVPLRMASSRKKHLTATKISGKRGTSVHTYIALVTMLWERATIANPLDERVRPTVKSKFGLPTSISTNASCFITANTC